MEEPFLAEPQRIVAAIRDRGTEVEDLGYKVERDHRFHLQGRRDGGDTYRRHPVRQCSPLAACLEIDADPLHLKLFQCLEKLVAAIRDRGLTESEVEDLGYKTSRIFCSRDP